MDHEANERLVDTEGRLSRVGARLQAWVIPTQEGHQMAHETYLAFNERTVTVQH
jgi:hypothetical protein